MLMTSQMVFHRTVRRSFLGSLLLHHPTSSLRSMTISLVQVPWRGFLVDRHWCVVGVFRFVGSTFWKAFRGWILKGAATTERRQSPLLSLECEWLFFFATFFLHVSATAFEHQDFFFMTWNVTGKPYPMAAGTTINMWSCCSLWWAVSLWCN